MCNPRTWEVYKREAYRIAEKRSKNAWKFEKLQFEAAAQRTSLKERKKSFNFTKVFKATTVFLLLFAGLMNQIYWPQLIFNSLKIEDFGCFHLGSIYSFASLTLSLTIIFFFQEFRKNSLLVKHQKDIEWKVELILTVTVSTE